MRRALLLFNPNAGAGGRSRRVALERVANVLRSAGIEAEIAATLGPGTAGVQAAGAIADGADTVFACGGDGTLHEVLQGLALGPAATVGVIPLGSANALARHLRLSLDPAEAMRQQLRFHPRWIPLGRVTCATRHGTLSRYFAVMAGAGPDGMLVYRMLATDKQRLGRAMYYARAARLFLSQRFGPFQVNASLDGGGSLDLAAVSVMAVRIGDLGGLFSPLVRGASPSDETLQLTLTEPPSHLALPAWFATSWMRTQHWNPWTQHLRVSSFRCTAANADRVHVQADGEWIGTAPMHVGLVPNALRLLMPASSTSPLER
jgi:diacylglycerol kinase family enzyme